MSQIVEVACFCCSKTSPEITGYHRHVVMGDQWWSFDVWISKCTILANQPVTIALLKSNWWHWSCQPTDRQKLSWKCRKTFLILEAAPFKQALNRFILLMACLKWSSSQPQRNNTWIWKFRSRFKQDRQLYGNILKQEASSQTPCFSLISSPRERSKDWGHIEPWMHGALLFNRSFSRSTPCPNVWESLEHFFQKTMTQCHFIVWRSRIIIPFRGVDPNISERDQWATNVAGVSRTCCSTPPFLLTIVVISTGKATYPKLSWCLQALLTIVTQRHFGTQTISQQMTGSWLSHDNLVDQPRQAVAAKQSICERSAENKSMSMLVNQGWYIWPYHMNAIRKPIMRMAIKHLPFLGRTSATI